MQDAATNAGIRKGLMQNEVASVALYKDLIQNESDVPAFLVRSAELMIPSKCNRERMCLLANIITRNFAQQIEDKISVPPQATGPNKFCWVFFILLPDKHKRILTQVILSMH